MNGFWRWVGLVVLFSGPLAAQERSLAIQRFSSTIKVNRDASIEVAETIDARFTGSWNGLYRTIPVEYRDARNFNWRIGVTLVSAADDQGQPLKTEVSRQGHFIKYKIWVPGATDAVKTVVLQYRATNALRFFPDHDELYWNVTGDEWDIPIESAAGTIILPDGAAGIRAVAFNGSYGATATDAQVTIASTRVAVMLPSPLGFHEGLTAVVGWNKGLVPEPTQTERALGFLSANWPLLLPIPVFFLMWGAWRRFGRDPAARPVAVQYEPPAGLTPAESGTLIDHSADMRDVTATVVDLAVRGYLRIEETHQAKVFGLIKDDDFVFHRLKPASEWTGLKSHEQRVLSGLFETGQASVALSDLKDEFYRHLPGIKDGIFGGLVAAKFYRSRPDNVRGLWVGLGVAVGVAIGFAGSMVAATFSLAPISFVIAGVLIGLIVIGFGLVMPARTEAGARAQERVLGFQEFLSRVDGDRLRDFVKTPEMFEQYLPFAMAFGVERKWAKAFDGIFTQSPGWYVGSNPMGFNAGTFSHRLSSMSESAASAMASSPRSSSGSGFSGGSSGGGGGGGGGGGF